MDLQHTKLQQQSNSLLRRIEAWKSVQVLYMPYVASLHAGQESIQSVDDVIRPEQYALFLPSALGAHPPSNRHLQEIEWRLQIGQAHDALEDL